MKFLEARFINHFFFVILAIGIVQGYDDDDYSGESSEEGCDDDDYSDKSSKKGPGSDQELQQRGRQDAVAPRKLSSPTECARSCNPDEPPKTCYYNFTVEYYATNGRACSLCSGNSPSRLVNDCQCITGDGYETSGIITANRMSPGPAIIVCLNDYVIIDVANHIPGAQLTIHWHGLFQRNYQYYDGVPYVTQCPINEGSIFRYQFRALNSGTHFWHSHTGLQKAEGLEGSFVVREPKAEEPNGNLWEFDDPEHTIFLQDFLHGAAQERYPGTYVRNPGQFPDNLLVNGMGQWTDPTTRNTTTAPLATFTVKRGHRYRFRLINSCSFVCPVQMTIQGHSLKIIASDGEPLKPVRVTSITSFSAERYDFVIHANKPVGNYWMQFRYLGECANRQMQQHAILRYVSAPTRVQQAKPSYRTGLRPGIVLNQLNVRCPSNETDVICISELKHFYETPKRILKKEPDIKLFLPFGFYNYNISEIYKPGTYNRYLVAGGGPTTALMGNITNRFPPVPMISQRDEIPESQVCTIFNKDQKCNGANPCECTSIHKVPVNAVVEIILVDEVQIPDLSHPFHLHGHSFFVMGEGCATDYNITSINVDKAKKLDKGGKMKRNWNRPPAKDTFAVPNNGFMIIRFIANNPGYWLFHCHFLVHLSVGMSTVINVGEHKDLPPVPKGFPRCGNFVPPIGN